MPFGMQRRPGCCSKNKNKTLPQGTATVGATFSMEVLPEEPQKAKIGPVTQCGETSGRDEGWEEPILHLMQTLSFSYKATLQGFHSCSSVVFVLASAGWILVGQIYSSLLAAQIPTLPFVQHQLFQCIQYPWDGFELSQPSPYHFEGAKLSFNRSWDDTIFSFISADLL